MGDRRKRGAKQAAPASATEDREPAATPANGRTRATTPKRKRKRRT
jgi:hypothetical protein